MQQPQIENILIQLCRINQDIEGGAVILGESKILAERFAAPNAAPKLNMISSLLLDLNTKYGDRVRVGEFRELHIQGSHRSAIIYDLYGSVLVLAIKSGANIGLVNIDGREAARTISQLINADTPKTQ